MAQLPPLNFEDELPPLQFEEELPPLKFDEAPQVGTTESVLRGVVQGVSFDMADNVQALAEAAKAKASGDSRPLKEIYVEKLKPIEASYEAAQKAHPYAYGGAGLAAGLAVPGVGWLKGGKTLGSAIKAGTAAGALTGAGQTSMTDIGETAKSVAQGALVGAAAGTVLHGAVKGVSDVASRVSKDPEVAARSVSVLNKMYTEALDQTKAIPGDFTKARAGEDPVFMKYLLKNTPDIPNPKSKEYKDKFRDVFGQYNESRQQELYELFLRDRQSKGAMAMVSDRITKELGAAPKDQVGSFGKWFRPATYTAYRVDEGAGTNFSKVMNDLIETENRWGSEAAPWLTVARDLKAKVEADQLYKQDPDAWNRAFYKKFNQRDTKDPMVLDVVKFFGDARDELNKKYGLNIQAAERPGEFYIPRTMMHMTDIRLKLDRGLEKIRQGSMDAAEREMFDDAVRVMADKVGADIDPEDLMQVTRFINDDLVPKKGKSYGYDIEASAAFKRDSEIPPYLVERDVFKLMGNYIQGNMKAGLYAKPLRELDMEIDKAQALGMRDTVEYFQSVRDKLVGVPSMKQASMRKLASDWKLHGDRMIREGQQAGNNLSVALGHMQKAAPDVVPFMMSHMYKNLLALNPYAVVRQFAQVPTLGTTDIAKTVGTAYASRVTGLGLLKGVKEGGLKSVNPYLKQHGLLKAGPPEDVMHRGIYEGLTEAGLPKPILKALGGYEKATNAAMKLYSGADALNRYWSAKMADQISADLIGSNKALQGKAFKYVNDMPPQLQNTVMSALKGRNYDEVARQIRNYTVNKHQFSYTTSDLNGLGREFGSLFTAFTKFPLSVMSDVEHEIYKNKMGAVLPLTAKYLAPLAMLMAADYASKEADFRKDPMSKLLIGQKFTDLSPALGVLVSPPPGLSVPYKTAETVVKGIAKATDKDISELPEHMLDTAKKATKAASPFLPGYGLYDYTTRRLERAGLKEKDKDK